jgi:hypothetical protein
VIGGFALLIVCVVAIGSLLTQQHVASRRASFRATPEKLFSLIAGPQDWRPDVLRDEPVPDTNGRELRRETSRDGETITYELLNRKPPQSITRRIATENLPYSGSWAISIQPEGEVTNVRITETGQVYNPVFRFVSRFVIGQTRTIDTYLRGLGKANGQEIEIRS